MPSVDAATVINRDNLLVFAVCLVATSANRRVFQANFVKGVEFGHRRPIGQREFDLDRFAIQINNELRDQRTEQLSKGVRRHVVKTVAKRRKRFDDFVGDARRVACRHGRGDRCLSNAVV